tara:strand:- start:691 stop:2184 length:1494 start_codon:yes stop_codon:yes gene_type:complete
MVNFTNIGRIAKFSSSNETVGLVDGVDAIHSGIIKAVEAWAQGNYLIQSGDLVTSTGSSRTNFTLNLDGVSVSNIIYSSNGEIKTLTGGISRESAADPDGSNDRYDWIVIQPSDGTLRIRQGTAADPPTCPDLTIDDIPVALVKFAGGSTANTATRPVQKFMLNIDNQFVGIGDDGGTGGKFVESMSIKSASGVTTIENKVADADMLFKVNDGGVSTEIARLVAATSTLRLASGKKLEFADAGEYISGNGTDLTIASGGDIALNPTGGDVTISDDTTNKPILALTNTTNDATSPAIEFYNNRSSGYSDADTAGLLKFFADDDGAAKTEVARITARIDDVTGGQEEGSLAFSVAEYDGTLTEAVRIAGQATNGLIYTGIATSAPKSTLHVNGSINTGWLEATGTVAAAVTNLCNSIIANSSGAFTINLPALADIGSGRLLYVANHNGGAATLDGNSSETISVPGGANATYSVGGGEWVKIVSDSSTPTWWLLSKGNLM